VLKRQQQSEARRQQGNGALPIGLRASRATVSSLASLQKLHGRLCMLQLMQLQLLQLRLLLL